LRVVVKNPPPIRRIRTLAMRVNLSNPKVGVEANGPTNALVRGFEPATMWLVRPTRPTHGTYTIVTIEEVWLVHGCVGPNLSRDQLWRSLLCGNKTKPPSQLHVKKTD